MNKMTPERIVLEEIRVHIKSLPDLEHDTVEEIAQQFRDLIKAHPNGEGHLALALVGAEYAAL